MKTLKDFINEQFIDESLLGFVKKIKDKIFKPKEAELKVGDKKGDMEKIVDRVNKEIKEKNKNPEDLIKDISEIIKKNIDTFKKIQPALNKWVENNDQKKYYSFDEFIGDKECNKFISNLCKLLSEKYGWDEIAQDDIEEYFNDWTGEISQEGEEIIVYNTAYIAFILSTISENL